MPGTYNLLLVGRTGNGKSSTGNAIFGRRVFDVHGANDNTGNDVIQKHNGEIDGNHIQVFDGTGIGDNGEGGIGDLSLFTSIEQQVFTDQHTSLTAIILVLKFGVRFTRQETESVEHVKFLLGDDVFRKCGVIVMTYGDNFNNDRDDAFKLWCESQSEEFKQLFEDCGRRCVLFNNRDRTRHQVHRLLNVIELSKLKSYTDDNFKRIRQERLLKTFERIIHSGKGKLKEIKKLHKQERKEAAIKFMYDLVQGKNDLEGSNIQEAQKKARLTDFEQLIKSTEMETHRRKKRIKVFRLAKKGYKYRPV